MRVLILLTITLGPVIAAPQEVWRRAAAPQPAELIGEINRAVRAELRDWSKIKGASAVPAADGPSCYPGVADGDTATPSGAVESLPRNCGVKRVLAGPTTTAGAATLGRLNERRFSS